MNLGVPVNGSSPRILLWAVAQIRDESQKGRLSVQSAIELVHRSSNNCLRIHCQ